MRHQNWRRRTVVLAATGAAIVATPLPAAAGGDPTTELVSVSSAGEPGQHGATSAAMSADGRLVVFESISPNLVAGDTNGSDIFLRDRRGVTSRISIGTEGQQGNHGSYSPSISADGRYVAFLSDASNLVAGDDNGIGDAFVRDLRSGTIARIPLVQTTTGFSDLSISADGRHLAFLSRVSPDIDVQGLYVRDLRTGSTRLVSVNSAGDPGDAGPFDIALSADASVVAFASAATNLVPDDTNGTNDVFTHDSRTGRTQRVSVGPDGAQLWDYSYQPAISADGRVVAFTSRDAGVVPHDTNGSDDIFVRDLRSGRTMLASIDPAGRRGPGHSSDPLLSADGRFVAFTSATTPDTQDTGRRDDVLLRDLRRQATLRVSHGAGGEPANGDGYGRAMTPDARHVAFTSTASNLMAGGTATNGLYVRGPLRPQSGHSKGRSR